MAGRFIKREQHLKGPEALHASTQVLWAPTLLTQLTALSLKLARHLPWLARHQPLVVGKPMIISL